MDPISIVALITTVIPFVTAGLKRFTTAKMEDTKTKAGLNALLPIVLGVVSAGLYTYQTTKDWKLALAAGLSSGGVASSARDIDKNLIGIVETVFKLVNKDESK